MVLCDVEFELSQNYRDVTAYVYFNGQTFSSVFEQFSFTSNFFGLKMQKSYFLGKMVLRVFFFFFFIKLTVRWLQTGLSDLKNTTQLKFCLW